MTGIAYALLVLLQEETPGIRLNSSFTWHDEKGIGKQCNICTILEIVHLLKDLTHQQRVARTGVTLKLVRGQESVFQGEPRDISVSIQRVSAYSDTTWEPTILP